LSSAEFGHFCITFYIVVLSTNRISKVILSLWLTMIILARVPTIWDPRSRSTWTVLSRVLIRRESLRFSELNVSHLAPSRRFRVNFWSLAARELFLSHFIDVSSFIPLLTLHVYKDFIFFSYFHYNLSSRENSFRFFAQFFAFVLFCPSIVSLLF